MTDDDPIVIPITPEVIEAAGQAAFGASPGQRKAKGLCVACGEPALAKCYSDAGRREVALSGMCEPCFDGLFADQDDDDGPVIFGLDGPVC